MAASFSDNPAVNPRVIRHFASSRAVEVLALQGSPVLGCILGGWSLERDGLLRLLCLLVGSLALTAHVFVTNDWADSRSDVRAPRRATLAFARRGISPHQVASLATLLFWLAMLSLLAVSPSALLLGGGIAALGQLYSGSRHLGKSTPVAASLNHLLGGALHFLLGYTFSRPLNQRGCWLSLFFGLVFAGGHLNQEVRDYDGDLLSGTRTSAVVFGRRPTFLASFGLFTAAYLLVAGLAVAGYLPERLVYGGLLLWAAQLAWSAQALRKGLSFQTAVWLQRRYRLLFACVGLAMVA